MKKLLILLFATSLAISCSIPQETTDETPQEIVNVLPFTTPHYSIDDITSLETARSSVLLTREQNEGVTCLLFKRPNTILPNTWCVYFFINNKLILPLSLYNNATDAFSTALLSFIDRYYQGYGLTSEEFPILDTVLGKIRELAASSTEMASFVDKITRFFDATRYAAYQQGIDMTFFAGPVSIQAEEHGATMNLSVLVEICNENIGLFLENIKTFVPLGMTLAKRL